MRTETDMTLLKILDVPAALGLLSRLPVTVDVTVATTRRAQAAWAYPVAGLVLGGVAAAVGLGVSWLGVPPALTALAILTCLIMSTGAMHEDGLADSADGLWGGWAPHQRLDIMKDSHIGTYGVVALGLSLLARWTALSTLVGAGHIVVPVLLTACLSRAPMVVLMASLPQARKDGLSAQVGRPGGKTMWVAIVISVLGGLVLAGGLILPLMFWIAVATGAVAWLAKSKIGGQTGDILGATQQVSEVVVLTVLASSLI